MPRPVDPLGQKPRRAYVVKSVNAYDKNQTYCNVIFATTPTEAIQIVTDRGCDVTDIHNID